MLSTPAHRVEELPNGAVLLVTWPIAADFARDEARLAQARAHAHLRPDLDFDTAAAHPARAQRHARPRRAPLPPGRWPRCSRAWWTRHASPSARRRIAELNA